MSSPAIVRDTGSLQSLGSILPSVAARTTETALRSGGKAGRTASELARLRLEAESEGYKAGMEQGFREGVERGIAQAHQKAYDEAAAAQAQMLAQFQAELGSVVESVQTALYRWCDDAEAEMAGLVTDIARRVMSSELQISRESVLAIAKEALKEVTYARTARIKANPFDLPMLANARQELLAVAGSLRQIEFVEDASIEGGCVIETEGGVVEATLEDRIDTLDEEKGAA